MSRYFPHTTYAEDQPLAGTILTVHVLVRSITTGTVIGTAVYGAQALTRRVRKQPAPLVPRSQLLLRGAGASTIWTLGIVSLGLVGRMWGRDDIEWKDRAWRLMENKGQVECDDFTYTGMLAGLGAAATKTVRKTGAVGVLGALGFGSAAGMVGYMGWRYGVHGGKFGDGEDTL